MGYTKLFDEIVTSSIWTQDDKTLRVWIMFLARKDKNGYVAGSVPGLASLCRVDEESFRKSLAILESPDADSRTKEHEGRRIEPVDGGWLVLNHAKYRDKTSNDSDAILARARQEKFRAKLKGEPVVDGVAQPDSECAEFEQFWTAYPKKRNKNDAFKAWLTTEKTRPWIVDLVASIAALAKTDDWRKDDGQFIPYPATFLRQGGWVNASPVEVEPTPYTRPLRPNERAVPMARTDTPVMGKLQEFKAE